MEEPTIKELEHTIAALKRPLTIMKPRKYSERKDIETANEQVNI